MLWGSSCVDTGRCWSGGGRGAHMVIWVFKFGCFIVVVLHSYFCYFRCFSLLRANQIYIYIMIRYSLLRLIREPLREDPCPKRSKTIRWWTCNICNLSDQRTSRWSFHSSPMHHISSLLFDQVVLKTRFQFTFNTNLACGSIVLFNFNSKEGFEWLLTWAPARESPTKHQQTHGKRRFLCVFV